MKRVWGLGLGALFIGLLVAGGGAQLLEVTMSRSFWSGMAVTADSADKLGWSAVAMSVFAALFALAGGALSRMNRKGVGRFVVGVALIFTAYNTWSVCGFQLKERLGRTIVEQQKRELAERANAARVASDTNVREEQLRFLRAAFKDAKKAEDKERLLARMEAVGQQAIRDDTANLPTVVPDVQALVFASNPAMMRKVQVGSVLGLAVLLAFGANIAFWLAGALLPQLVTDKAAADKAASPTKSGKIEAKARKEVEKPKTAAAVDADPIPFRSAGQSARSKEHAASDERRAVEEFLVEARAAGKPGACIKAEAAHQWFCAWCKASRRPALSLTKFGRLIGEIDAAIRFTDGKHVFYRGLSRPAFALIEGDKEAA